MSPPSIRRRRPYAWTWQAFLGAFLVLGFLGDVWHAGHLLLVPHLACPYDGALVHEDDLSPEALALARAGSLVASHPTSVAPRHEHQDCSGFSAVQRHAVILPSHRGPAQPTTEVPSEPCVTAGHEVRRDVLTYAPRLPPPT
jgi:hypothetical protein